MIALLQRAVTLGLLRPLDVQLAQCFGHEESPLLTLAIAWLSAEVGAGHVCIALDWLKKENLFNHRESELTELIWNKANQPKPSDWLSAIANSDVVGDGSTCRPFVLQDGRLYLQRMWLDEGRVAQFFNQDLSVSAVDSHAVKEALSRLFDDPPGQEINWQKVAAAIAVSQRVAVISGGPGTGKTTTVAKLLAALILLSDKPNLRITLAAPTGKAAARLTESLGHAIAHLPLTEAQRSLIPSEAATVHRLLGVKPNSQQVHYNQDNPLHIDILVVDEASMIDLPMMAKLIAALPKHARFILLGDKEQLASVEAGAVLGDICRFVDRGYSLAKTQQLCELTGYRLESDKKPRGPTIGDSLCLLRKSYRFAEHSGIGQLAWAVNSGSQKEVLSCLTKDYNDIEWHLLSDPEDYLRLIEVCVEGYQPYLQMLSQKDPKAILNEFNRFQLLCALRSGPFGVQGLNERIEKRLVSRQLIHKRAGVNGQWYAGRPVMVNRNDSALGLYNGDIGIALYDENQELRVYFQLPDGTLRSVQTNRLPECETAFAMTVHKSQGSEFSHTVLALPDTYSPLITRELVYTAITRAIRKLTLFSSETILSMAVRKPTERRSGLVERLT